MFLGVGKSSIGFWDKSPDAFFLDTDGQVPVELTAAHKVSMAFMQLKVRQDLGFRARGSWLVQG